MQVLGSERLEVGVDLEILGAKEGISEFVLLESFSTDYKHAEEVS